MCLYCNTHRAQLLATFGVIMLVCIFCIRLWTTKYSASLDGAYHADMVATCTILQCMVNKCDQVKWKTIAHTMLHLDCSLWSAQTGRKRKTSWSRYVYAEVTRSATASTMDKRLCPVWPSIPQVHVWPRKCSFVADCSWVRYELCTRTIVKVWR